MLIGVYRTTDKGSKRVAELRLSSDGKVLHRVTDPAHRDFVQWLLKEGVVSYSQHRRIRAVEGGAFLEAVLESVQSSYWRARDETKAISERPRPRKIPTMA